MPFTDLIHILAQLGLYNLEVIMYLFHPEGMAFEPLIPYCKQHVHHYNYVQIFWVYILWKAERKLLAICLTYHIHLLHDAISKSQYNDVQETNWLFCAIQPIGGTGICLPFSNEKRGIGHKQRKHLLSYSFFAKIKVNYSVPLKILFFHIFNIFWFNFMF